MIDFNQSHLLFGMAALAVTLIFLGKQKRSPWYLFFFSVFWIYLLYVVRVIVFPIFPVPREYTGIYKPSLNLIPFYFGPCEAPRFCLRNIVGNILLTMPFGFGVSFIARVKPKNVLWLAFLVGLAFEATQFITSFLFNSFRVTDINDVILNALGVWLGYWLFRMFGYLYLHITQRFGMQDRFIFAYVRDVVHQSTDY